MRSRVWQCVNQRRVFRSLTVDLLPAGGHIDRRHSLSITLFVREPVVNHGIQRKMKKASYVTRPLINDQTVAKRFHERSRCRRFCGFRFSVPGAIRSISCVVDRFLVFRCRFEKQKCKSNALHHVEWRSWSDGFFVNALVGRRPRTSCSLTDT